MPPFFKFSRITSLRIFWKFAKIFSPRLCIYSWSTTTAEIGRRKNYILIINKIKINATLSSPKDAFAVKNEEKSLASAFCGSSARHSGSHNNHREACKRIAHIRWKSETHLNTCVSNNRILTRKIIHKWIVYYITGWRL